VPFTREQIREAVERAGDEHWQALIQHHEDAYPASRPTPGDVARGLADVPGLRLVESRVERDGPAVRITHVFESGPQKARLLTEPYTNYE
jgi:hypothetical protein